MVRVTSPQLSEAVTGGRGGSSQSTSRSSGTPSITGGPSSPTVMTWVSLTALPQLSVAVQVRVIIKVPAQAMLVVSWVRVTGTSPSQVSIAVTSAGGGTWSFSQSLSRSSGTPSRVGAVVSTTVTVRLTVVSLPQMSVAVTLCSILKPQAKTVVSAAGVCVTAPPQLSAKVSVNGGSGSPHSICTSSVSPSAKAGGVESVTVI